MAETYSDQPTLAKWNALAAHVAAAESAAAGGLKIQTGSYTGTGTYGPSNKNTLTFDFEPKVLFVAPAVSASFAHAVGRPECQGLLTIRGINPWFNPGTADNVPFDWNGNAVSWYSTTTAKTQLNESGVQYLYLAIG